MEYQIDMVTCLKHGRALPWHTLTASKRIGSDHADVNVSYHRILWYLMTSHDISSPVHWWSWRALPMIASQSRRHPPAGHCHRHWRWCDKYLARDTRDFTTAKQNKTAKQTRGENTVGFDTKRENKTHRGIEARQTCSTASSNSTRFMVACSLL